MIAALVAAGLVAIGLLAWAVISHRRLLAARTQAATLTAALIKLGHDLRGVLSPAMLMSERLETHKDPAIREAGKVIAQSVDRASALSQQLSRLARGHTVRD